ncbi:PucR family transcriptional regulator [Nocardia sp. NPDC020380]|uniref:PucR family transcriptional regulator n=1 Tax=Nocardia sp. NPDC020380 TaxID=3364309 RepID=UPI00378FDA70
MVSAPATVRSLVAELGPGVARLVTGTEGADRSVTAVEIYDPVHPDLRPGAFLLGAGVHTTAGFEAFLDHAVRHRAAAVAVKGDLAITPDPALPIVRLSADVSWMDIASTLREQLLGHVRMQWSPAATATDLFAVADVISATMAAPVTIENAASSLVAWSAWQGPADAMRIESILSRAVPADRVRALEERGVFDALRDGTEPVFVPRGAAGDDASPRVAIAVRGGGMLLGYIWLVVSEPLSEEKSRQLAESTDLVAAYLMNAGADMIGLVRRRRRALAEAMVAGGPAGTAAAKRLGLASGPVCVLAIGPVASEGDSASTDPATVANLGRLEDLLGHYLAAVHPSGVAIRGDQTVYGLLAWPRSSRVRAADATRSLAMDFAGRTPMLARYKIAVSPPAEALSRLPESRIQADGILRAMQHPGITSAPVADLDDMALPLQLLQLADYADSIGMPEYTGPIAVLAAHEGPDGQLMETLRAYLAAAAQAETAAAALHIHVNTLRYRLRRIREVCGLDLRDADAMLLAHLQLRCADLRHTN